jgi:hypothetical protein
MTEYDEYQDYDEDYAEPQSRNRTWLILAIVVIAVLLCCCCLALVAGYFIFQEDISDALSMLTGVMTLA